MTLSAAPKSFGMALRGLATAWLLTTFIAWAAILRASSATQGMDGAVVPGEVCVCDVSGADGHLPSVTARLGSPADDAATNVTGLSWVAPLAVYEVILQCRRLFRAGMNP